jgi:hypothetical protein
MDKYRRIAELMKGFQQSGQVFFPATVESVEGATCTVKVDGLSISDVRLKATASDNMSLIPGGIENSGFELVKNRVLTVPLIGSSVLVGSLSGDCSNLFVLQFDVIDRIEITCNGQNLMQLLSQCIQVLSNAKVITPNGNGTFDPGTISQLNIIENSFKQIFK